MSSRLSAVFTCSTVKSIVRRHSELHALRSRVFHFNCVGTARNSSTVFARYLHRASCTVVAILRCFNTLTVHRSCLVSSRTLSRCPLRRGPEWNAGTVHGPRLGKPGDFCRDVASFLVFYEQVSESISKSAFVRFVLA